MHPTLNWACNYLSMLGLKLNHVNKRGRWPGATIKRNCQDRSTGNIFDFGILQEIMKMSLHIFHTMALAIILTGQRETYIYIYIYLCGLGYILKIADDTSCHAIADDLATQESRASASTLPTYTMYPAIFHSQKPKGKARYPTLLVRLSRHDWWAYSVWAHNIGCETVWTSEGPTRNDRTGDNMKGFKKHSHK